MDLRWKKCSNFTALCPRSRHSYAKMARINIYQEDWTRTRLLTPDGGGWVEEEERGGIRQSEEMWKHVHQTCEDSQPVTANPYRSSLVHKKIVFHTHTGVKHNSLIKWSPPVISINLFNSSCKLMGQWTPRSFWWKILFTTSFLHSLSVATFARTKALQLILHLAIIYRCSLNVCNRFY